MLILNSEEMYELLSINELIDSVEKALNVFTNNAYVMPNRFVAKNDPNSMLYMPCFTDYTYGTKILSSFPDNHLQNKPLLDGLMLLTSPEDGSPLCIMNGQTLTALRTGAIGGLAVKYLSNKNSSSVALIGCGVQGFEQLRFACAIRPIKDIYLYNRNLEKIKPFILKLKKYIPVDTQIHICHNSEEAALHSDIIITATTSSTPVLPNKKALFQNKCTIAIGSWQPEMQEIPNALWSVVDKAYIELPYAKEESGDLSTPLSNGLIQASDLNYLGEFIQAFHNNKGLEEPPSTTFFKSVGMGIYDNITGYQLYQKALEKEIGTQVTL